MKVAVNKVAVLLRRNSAHSVNADAARMPNYLANHVLCHFVLVTTHREIAVAPLSALAIAVKSWERDLVEGLYFLKFMLFELYC